MRPTDAKFATIGVKATLMVLEADGDGGLDDEQRVAKLKTWLLRNEPERPMDIADARHIADDIAL